MKRSYIKWLFCLLVISCLLSGCRGNKKNGNTINSMENTTTVNDFKITFSTEKAEYERKELTGKKVPHIVYKAELEYIGEKESIKIWHASRIGTLSLFNQEGKNSSNTVISDMLVSSVLEKNKPVSIDEWDGRYEIRKPEALEPGAYTVRVHVKFHAGEDFKDKEHLEYIECVVSLPLVIRK